MMQVFSGGAKEWNELITKLPNPHLLQSWEWAQVKAAYGWKPMPFVWQQGMENRQLGTGEPQSIMAAAMLLKKQVISRGFAARLCILYLPKGPVMDWSNGALRKQVLDDLQAFSMKQGAIFLKLDPDVVLGTGVPGVANAQEDAHGQSILSDLKRRGWLFSSDQIQFRNTILVDVRQPEVELRARMKQKTRYNVRIAERKGVVVRVGTQADLSLLYKMYAETSARDGFVIRDEGYYRTVWGTFMKPRAASQDQRTDDFQPLAEPLIAEVQGEPVAAMLVFYFARRAYYLYGMSRDAHREKMPNYLLQWEAMKRAKMRGCSAYDLWGAPDEFNTADSMWGVFQFKEGLGGQVVRTLGAWDFPASPVWYKTYTRLVPRLLDLMRARGKSRTKRALE